MIKIKLDQALNEKFTEEDLLSTIQSNNSEKKFALAIQLILKTDKAEFGLHILNGLDLSELIDENFIEDLIVNSSVLPLSSPFNFLKLILIVSEVNSNNMAIQKHLLPQAVQNKQENKEHFNINSLLKIIEQIDQQSHKLTPEQMVDICTVIIIELSNVPLPRDAIQLSIIKADVLKIGDFFLKLTLANDDRMRFLELIYSLLSSPIKEPTALLSLGLLVIPNEMIKTALECFFSSIQWSGKKTKESIVTTMGRLIYWLRTSQMPVPLDDWIVKTIIVLNSTGMHEIVNEVAKKNILPAFLAFLVPIFQSKMYAVVQALLENCQNQQEVMDQVAPRIVNVFKQLENTNCVFLDSLMELICDALGLINNELPQYKEIMDFLELRNRTPAKVIMKKKLNGQTCSEYLLNNARVGLLNLGNTCYLNSILQALFMTKQFCREILTTQRNDNASFELQKLFALMLCSPRPEQNPRIVVNLIRPDDFIAGIQHDSSEFLCSLLDRLHELEKKKIKDDEEEDWDNDDESISNKKITSVASGASIAKSTTMDCEEANNEEESSEANNEHMKEPVDKIIDNTANNFSLTYVQKIFGGKICTRYLCKTCNSNSINVDLFRDLQLSFPERSQDENCDMQYNVQQLLEYYFSTEELSLIGNNQYHCDNCKILCNGVRCTEILEPPRNLILTLKHFRYDSRHHTRSKLLYKVFHDEHISVTVKSSLKTNCTRNVDYKLYAAVIHCGNSLDNGHYYTIARENDSKWFKFNDSFVTKSSLDELRGLISPNTPYILFYQRLSTASASATAHSESASVSSSSNVDTFPDYQELSMFLKDYIDDDKNKYENDMILQKSMSYEKVHPTIKNNFDNNDNNDPGTGSFNFDQSFAQNRYIF
ncbi:hypothetical protein PVAND_005428 [Polypedilum vanderplanki]|uniref:USP domain-containing protein n=1 Tax=Polypedilum vanderplanki TaxID=319348 RepID=A0A9J6C052_POLVA|nr:hypothetical protein PVAND_005428 [Polypedilum vanderplanki]